MKGRLVAFPSRILDVVAIYLYIYIYIYIIMYLEYTYSIYDDVCLFSKEGSCKKSIVIHGREII